MKKQESKQKIAKLIEKYEKLVDEKKVKLFNEAQTRNEFIEPLFEFLGWDMRNLENPGEVTTEENVSKGRVDLAFRLNHIPVMFLEAKALRVDLDEWKWAEQAINYSWNKSVTWAILTDFEGIKIFNAEIPPKSLSQNLFFELKWHEYLDRFDQLWLLSKESFAEKLLAEQAEKWGKLTKRKQVGEKLFEDLTNWRAKLTKDFKKNNNVDEDALDEGVQKVLDRLIFIRTAEDRKIEPNILLSILREWETAGKKRTIYKKLTDTFKRFDEDYNSKLFASHALEEWEASDKIIEEIIKGLYQTEDGYRYDFSAISTDVLGGIYEQYLGYVQEKAQKVGTDKKTKRKSQGIYYTPKYIVEYLIEQTLGEVLKKAKKKDLPNIKILDPACGSGSFLISAYDKMLEAKNKLETQTGLFDKFEILKNNIYGVDLDEQAIEIARLNLLLRVLSQKTKLPTLSHNIRIGNSLVDGEVEKLEEDFGEKWREQKAFNWKKEFEEVFEQGGFDVIIGNPPYIKEDTNRNAFNGLHKNPYYQGKMDIWTLFACRAIDLLKDGGLFSFIAPSSWIGSAGASVFRSKILTSGEIIKFVDFNDFKVFKDASIQTMIFVFKKKKPRKSYKLKYAKITNKNTSSEEVADLLASGLNRHIKNVIVHDVIIKPAEIGNQPISFASETVSEILDKIETISNFKFSKKDIGNGIDVLQDFITEKHLLKLKDETIKKGDGVFVLKNSVAAEMKLNSNELEYLKPYYATSQINRYLSNQKNEYKIIYADKYFREHVDEFPNLKKHIDCYKKILTSAFAPYGLHRPREERFFEGQAIFLLRKTMYPAFTYVDFPCYVTRAFLVLKPEAINLKYLTALLNSKLVYFWLKHKGKKQGEQLQIDKEPLMNIPLFKANEKKQGEIAKLAQLMLDLQKELQHATANTDKHARLKTEIEKLDEKIDQIIYKLYNLTNEEIKTIEK
ncbi:N-6 DNA methylase [Candidatus Parcubacteria bacterium]|nr:N-6 DNA methylase [Candidatus Parcubacteria bacterium]